jgi:hypothetical protein
MWVSFEELNKQNGHRMPAMKSHTNGKASPAAAKPIVNDSKPNRRRANMINYNEDNNQDNSDTDDIPARSICFFFLESFQYTVEYLRVGLFFRSYSEF